MRRTGVFATREEVARLKEQAGQAAETPAIALSVADGLAGRDFASLARERLMHWCHEAALAHGLPEVPGWYGCDLETGEFLEA